MLEFFPWILAAIGITGMLFLVRAYRSSARLNQETVAALVSQARSIQRSHLANAEADALDAVRDAEAAEAKALDNVRSYNIDVPKSISILTGAMATVSLTGMTQATCNGMVQVLGQSTILFVSSTLLWVFASMLAASHVNSSMNVSAYRARKKANLKPRFLDILVLGYDYPAYYSHVALVIGFILIAIPPTAGALIYGYKAITWSAKECQTCPKCIYEGSTLTFHDSAWTRLTDTFPWLKIIDTELPTRMPGSTSPKSESPLDSTAPMVRPNVGADSRKQ